MVKNANLVCLFNQNYTPSTINQMAEMGDSCVYEKAKEGISDGSTDIYTLTDFAIDFNHNRLWTSPEFYNIIFIQVDESEVSQWMK